MTKLNNLRKAGKMHSVYECNIFEERYSVSIQVYILEERYSRYKSIPLRKYIQDGRPIFWQEFLSREFHF